MDDSQANHDHLAERLKSHAEVQPRRKQAEVEQQSFQRSRDALISDNTRSEYENLARLLKERVEEISSDIDKWREFAAPDGITLVWRGKEDQFDSAGLAEFALKTPRGLLLPHVEIANLQLTQSRLESHYNRNEKSEFACLHRVGCVAKLSSPPVNLETREKHYCRPPEALNPGRHST